MDNIDVENETIMRIEDVSKKTGLCKSTIYDLTRKGKFPHPIKLAERCSGWLESEVNQWIKSRILASRKEIK